MGNFPFIVIDLIPYRSLKTAFFLIQIARIVRKSQPITPAQGFLSIPVNRLETVQVYLINSPKFNLSYYSPVLCLAVFLKFLIDLGDL
ncbi:hypothetical protein MiYa_03110 [Microcystis aeruginosa NIES-2519]|uniref:Uncharacterized protein n=1 Tax=Microcystis aeruginosa NIES-2519 TaxID=2303981 RepID=A0A5A5R9V4_MICAE|nr:hypothetical protein MiYa_03110 [Microcystis aeruginosa NIES-2519]